MKVTNEVILEALNRQAGFMNKQVLEITETRIKLSKIEQHLKDLNGSVARHENNINTNGHNISKIKVEMAKYGVIFLFVLAFIQFAVQKLFGG